MFETVAPETTAQRSRKLFYETLPVSIGIHALVVASLITASIWNAGFPNVPPRLYAVYSLAEVPSPPPPPPPPLPARVVPHVRPVPMLPDLAPTMIPETIPDLSEPPPAEVTTTGVEGSVGSGEIGGESDGAADGVVGSVTVAPPPPPPAMLEVKRDVMLPMGAISQEIPSYPEDARNRGWEDELVVRYHIGKDGKVKEVVLLQPPQREEFAREAMKAIRRWRFHPYRDELGEPREVLHELTVVFKLNRKKR